VLIAVKVVVKILAAVIIAFVASLAVGVRVATTTLWRESQSQSFWSL
jgi:hypothetical protein